MGSVAPERWVEAGGTGATALLLGNKLFVVAPAEVQRGVSMLLGEIVDDTSLPIHACEARGGWCRR